MKKMRNLMAVLAAMVMVLAMSVTAFAAPTDTTITVPNTDDHTYTVYQIMTGDLSTKADGTKILSNATWGSNATKTGDVSESDMKTIAQLTKASDIATYVNMESTPISSTLSATNPVTVKTGYYLIKDNGKADMTGDAYSLYIIEVVGPTEVNTKKDVPSSEKKVKDDESPNYTEANPWNDSADYDIGDAVPFQLKATVASDYDNYKNGYKLTFHDKESAGLTFDPTSVKVYVDGTEITNTQEKTYFTVTAPAADGDTFDVAFANLKEISAVHADSVITVEYTSTLNENAKIGAEGNPNTSHITYSNNPNATQEGGNIPEGGKTPDDTVIVFTYKVVVNKYANSVAEGNKLEGAEFTLTKTESDGTTKTIAVVKSGDGCTFTFSGLDAGTYTLTETKTPPGYNTIEPITIVITATHDVTADAPKLNTLTVTPAESFTVEMTGEGNSAKPTGTINGNVINQSGSTLPETGGMGTTVFYLLGGLMVLCAGVLLITKRRMAAK